MKWIQDPQTGELLEPEAYYARKAARLHGKSAYHMPDIKPFVSPLDFSVVSSRSTLREHEKKHNVIQVGDLKTPQDFSNEARRASFNERAFDAAARKAAEKVWR